MSLTVTNADGADMLVRENYITVTGGGGFPGEGFILSRNPCFSTDDRTFAADETLYMLVWTDRVNFSDIKKAEWIATADTGAEVYRVPGPKRSVLYVVASNAGFRFGECVALRWRILTQRNPRLRCRKRVS